MFRLNRHKSDRSSGEKVECKLSNFQAFQVPRGWDKLFLSVVSMETGKTIAKSSKAVVYGGTCQWTESFSESIWVYQDDLSKEFEECLYKISVAMGSARSGLLGELILNLTDYMKSRDSGPISLPLKKCNYGSILQIKIQCYPKTRSRDRSTWKEPAYHHEDLHSNDEDKDNRSDGSDNMLAKSLASSSGSHLGITSSGDQIGIKEPNLSAPESHRSSDSGEGSVGRTTFSPIKSSNGGIYMGRQESAGSQISATSGAGPDDVSRSNQSSFNSRASDSSYQTNHWQDITSQLSAHGTAPLSSRLSETSKELLEAAEETIEELHDEAKMWERHSQKVKHDLEMLKKESSEKSKHLANLEMELSSACVERDSLKQEVIQLQASMKGLMAKQNVTTTTKIDDMIRVQNALEDELRFQKEYNTNLNLQMKKTQEANIELVSILQELEETVERQNLEIANLSQNSQIFEQEDDPRSQALLDIETEWESKLTSKEDEIIKLEEKLSDILNAQRRGELVCDEGDPEMTKEIEALKTKVQELERDCTELTEENLELIFKMKETGNNAREEKPFHHSTYHESKNNISHDHSEFMIGLLKPGINHAEQDLRKKEMLNDDLTIRLNIQIKGLEEKCTDLEIELQHFKEQSCHLDTELQKSQAQVREKLQELTELQQKLGNLQDTDTRYFDIGNEAKHVEIEACSTMEISGILSEVYEQLHLAMTRLRNLCHDGDSDTNSDCVNDNGYVKPSSWDTSTQKEQAEAVLNDFLELNRLLGDGIVVRESLFRDMGAAIFQEDVISEGQQHLNSNRLREKTSKKLLVGRSFGNDTDEEMVGSKSEIEELESRLLSKDKEIDSLDHSVRDLEALLSDIEREKGQLEENVEVLELSNRDLEDLVSGIQKEKGLLEENLEVLEHSNKDLEDLISGIQREKSQLEDKLADALRERSTSSKCLDDVRDDLMELTRNMEAQVSINEMLENKSLELESSKKELKIQLSESEVEKAQLSVRMSGLESQLRNLTSEKESHIQELEDSKSLIMNFTRDVESHVSTNKMLERKSLELESVKSELETHLSELKVENAQLSKHISGLEAQLMQLSSEKETNRLDLEDSKTLMLDLKDELLKQKIVWETQMSELKQKLQEAHKQLLEAQEETEYLKRTRSKLQATVTSLTEEYDSVQKLNEGLRKQKLELHERCTHVEVELKESEKKGIEFCKKVECLELELSSLQKDTDSKEKSLISQVESIFQEQQKHEAKLNQAHLILSQMESAKSVEVEHLKREIAHLTLQASSSHDEQDSMKSDAVREVFNLRLDKSKLETSLQEADAKVKLYETEINSLRQESGKKVQGLVDLLNSSKQTEDILMADIQRMQSLMASVKTSEEKFRTTTNELEVKLKASDYEKQQVLEEISSLKVKLEKMAHLQEELSTLEHSLNEEKFEKGKLERSLHSISEECEELKTQGVSFMERISNMQNALRDGEDDRRSRIALEEKLLMLERDLNAREASGVHEAELKDELNHIKRTHSECQRKIQCLEEEKGDFLKRAQVLEKELMLKNEHNHDEAVLYANGVNDMQHMGADQHDNPDHTESSQVGKEVDLQSKIHTLENELAQALETSKLYKVQLTSILTEQQSNDAAIPKETGSNDTNSDSSSRIAALEVELKEMQERYLHMSLQYAEVEASREELVMQLKSSQKGKRWFS